MDTISILISGLVLLILYVLQKLKKSHGNYDDIPGPRSYPLIGEYSDWDKKTE